MSENEDIWKVLCGDNCSYSGVWIELWGVGMSERQVEMLEDW